MRHICRMREKFEVLYDLVLTTPEDVIPSDVTVVHPTGIYCTASVKAECKARGDRFK